MNPAATPRPKFGEIAIQRGWLGPEHVDWALKVQAERRKSGVHIYLATILLQQRYISVDQAAQILRQQQVQIMIDPNTGYRYNVHNFQRGTNYKSPESPASLQPLAQVDSLIVRGDIGLRQVQGAAAPAGAKPQAAGAAGAKAGGGWAGGGEASAKQMDGEWGAEAAAATAQPVAAAASGPVYAELTSEEKSAGADENIDWYGQTILDDGSLAEQLKAAAQAAKAPGKPAAQPQPQPQAHAQPVAHAVPMAQAIPATPLPMAAQPVLSPVQQAVRTTQSTQRPVNRAKPGTFCVLALPNTPEASQVYRVITDLCAAKGIGTVRMDDVSDTTPIWKSIERVIQGSNFIIADFTGAPQPQTHVVNETRTAQAARKPVVVITQSPATKAFAQQLGLSAGDYPPNNLPTLRVVVDGLIDRMMEGAGLKA